NTIGAGVNGAAGRESTGLVRTSGLSRPVEPRLVISDPQEQPAAIHPEEDEPEHRENGHTLEKGRVGSTQEIEGVPAEVRLQVVSDENFPSARQLVRRFRDQAALRTGSGNLCSGSVRSRRQVSSSPLRRAASSAAKASTPWGDQLIPWSLQRADTAQSLYFSTRVLAIHNPARCRCW